MIEMVLASIGGFAGGALSTLLWSRLRRPKPQVESSEFFFRQ